MNPDAPAASDNVANPHRLASREQYLPTVSIVIPAYNHADFLVQAVDSVLNQNYPKIELIVLDDGSIDNTRDVLARYGAAFRWQSHTNMGQANTLNKGWQMAKGEILSYLSADDTLLPEAVSTSVRYLRQEVVLTYGDFNLIDPASKIVRRVRSPEFNYKEMFTKCVCHPGPGAFFTRRAFAKAGLWNGALRQMPDFDYWLRLGLIGDFKRIPEVLATFRVHDRSQTHARADDLRADEPVEIVRAFVEGQLANLEIQAHSNQALSSAHLVSAQLHIRANRYGRGLEKLGRAVSLYPQVLLRPRTYRVLANGLFNHSLHRLARFRNRIA